MMVIVMPKKVIRTFTFEWQKFIAEDGGPLHLQLVIAHASVLRGNNTQYYTTCHIDGLMAKEQLGETKDSPPFSRRCNLRYFVITTAESAYAHLFSHLTRTRQVPIAASVRYQER
jgi:hypothetical protein